MNTVHVVHSASKAVLRASNALEDLQSYLLQLTENLPPGLSATSRKVGAARELVREIDLELNGSLESPKTQDNEGAR